MKQIGKANSFLIELIIVIFFFAIASTVTLQLFMNAQAKTSETKQLSMAVINVQSALEKARSGIESGDISLQHVFDGSDLSGGVYTLYYDKDWKRVTENGYYSITVSLKTADTKAGSFYIVTAAAARSDGSVIWMEETEQYVPDFIEAGNRG